MDVQVVSLGLSGSSGTRMRSNVMCSAPLIHVHKQRKMVH
jgi:hypothetical protein